MATRLYFSGYTPPVSPGFYAEWDRTSAAVRRTLRLNKVSNTNAQVGGSETVTSAPYDVLLRQFVSDPLQAQTISGTGKGQIRAMENDPASDQSAAVIIRVVSNDGLTERGVLLAYFPGSLVSEFPAAFTNRYFPPSTALTPVTCQDGDRLVVEVGYRAFNTVTATYTGYVWFNNTIGTADLPEDETATNNLCPWIEFSQTLLWDQVQVNQAVAQVEYQLSPLLQANQVIAQVEYGMADRDVIQQLIAQVEYKPWTTGMHSLQVLAQVEGKLIHRLFPAPPAGRRLQSQAGKRVFPVIT